ncbi:MAG: hypothetical protein MHMPM18_002527, partial [Marteilia pararefringens]
LYSFIFLSSLKYLYIHFFPIKTMILILSIFVSQLIDFLLRKSFSNLRNSEIQQARTSKFVVGLNLLFIFSCFDLKMNHEILYAGILISVQIVSYIIFDVFRSRLKDVYLGSNSGYKFLIRMIFATLLSSCIYFHLLLMFESDITDKYFLEYTTISNIRMVLMNLLTISVEIILNAIYPVQALFFLRTAIGPLAEICILTYEMRIVYFLLKRSLAQHSLLIYFTRTFYIVKITFVFFKGIFYVLRFVQRIYNQLMAERKFKKASKLDLKEYNRPCSICWEDMKDGRMLSCQHIFHSMCIKEWLLVDKTCPLCRKNCFSQSSTNDRGPIRPIIELDFSSWLPYLPVIEIYQSDSPIMPNVANFLHQNQAAAAANGQLPANNIVQSQEPPTNVRDEHMEQVAALFPHLSPALIRSSLHQTRSVASTVELILENQSNFLDTEQQANDEDDDDDENISADNEEIDQNSHESMSPTTIADPNPESAEKVKRKNVLTISAEEYQELMLCNRDLYLGAFNINNAIFKGKSIDELRSEMQKYSRRQYLLKNLEHVHTSEPQQEQRQQ